MRVDIIRMAEYILSQNHERDDCLRVTAEQLSDEPMNRSQLRKIVQEHIWYIASRAAYGRAYASKAVTELLNEL